MYTQLRNNIISTVYESWHSTGFAWEQYNPETGAGQRIQGFTGWTALVINILAMPEFTNPTIPEMPKPQHAFGVAAIVDGILSMIIPLGIVLFMVLAVMGIPIWRAYYVRNYGRAPAGYTGLVRVERPNPNYLPLRLLRMGQVSSLL